MVWLHLQANLTLLIDPYYMLGMCKQDNMSHTHLLYDCFCDYFLGNIIKIFLEYYWKIFEKIFIIFFKILFK